MNNPEATDRCHVMQVMLVCGDTAVVSHTDDINTLLLCSTFRAHRKAVNMAPGSRSSRDPGGPRHRRTVASLKRHYNEATKRREIIANKST